MFDASSLPQAIDTISVINAAVRNIRLYPAGSAQINNSIAKAHHSLETLLQQVASVFFAESEKSLIVCDYPLPEKDQSRPQVKGFMALMHDLGIRTLGFQQGLQANELLRFLDIVSRTPENLQADGGLQHLLPQASIPHIQIDQKLYVALDQGQKLVEEDHEADSESPKTGGDKGLISALKDIEARGSAKQESQFSRVLYLGLQPFLDLHEGGTSPDPAQLVSRLVESLAGLADASEQTAAIESAAGQLAKLDDDLLARLLAGDIPPEETAQRLIMYLIDRIDEEKFMRITTQLHHIRKTAGAAASEKGFDRAGEDGFSGAQLPSRAAERAFRRLAESPRGKNLDLPEGIAGPESQPRSTEHLNEVVSNVLTGSTAPLADDRVVRHLPIAFQQLRARGSEKTVETMFNRLTAGLQAENFHERVGAAQALADIAGQLPEEVAAEKFAARIQDISQWLEKETQTSPAFETLFSQLKIIIQVQIRQRQYAAANRILSRMVRIADEKDKSRPALGNLCRNVISSVASKDILTLLIEAIQGKQDDMEQSVIIETLALLNPVSAELMLDQLRETKAMSLRSLILRIFPALGNPGRLALIRRIQINQPWYYTRNLVTLMGKMGLPKDVEILKPFLYKGDRRVQREALNSIYNLGGDYRGDLLLAYLPAAEEDLILNVVVMLGTLSYVPAVPALVDLLKSSSRSIRIVKQREELQEKICAALERIESPEAIPALEEVIQTKGLFGFSYGERVKTAARKALEHIRRSRPQRKTVTPAERKTAASQADLPERIAAVDRLVAAGEKESAVRTLFDLIVEQVGRRNFKTAEKLLQKLQDIDASALTEIVRSREIIEAQRSRSIDRNHLENFKDLYDQLTIPERSALFKAMQKVACQEDQSLLQQGEPNDHLYFIHAGDLKVFYRQGDREMLLSQIGAGGLVGAESFFHATLATVSAMTLNRVMAYNVERSAIKQWRKETPSLETKLRSFCLGSEKTAELLSQKGMDRRQQRRIPIDGRVMVQICNASGQFVGKPFSGNVKDLSAGGASFSFRSSKPDIGRLLLGKRLHLTFNPAEVYIHRALNASGAVTSANHLSANMYSIHVRFDRTLDQTFIDANDVLSWEFDL